jgi:glycosyltransferase involved in cell wall biosynthesis
MQSVIVDDAPDARDAPNMRIVAVIPAYNEERCIGSVALKAQRYAESVIVVDDGSTDSTAEIAEDAGAIVVRHASNRGKGVALNTGFKRAHQMGADVVVTFDADGQHKPEDMAAVIAPVLDGRADIVVGSRYLIRTSDVPAIRVVGHWIFNFITNRSSGVSVTDSQSGFRAFSARALRAIFFSSRSFSVESEMQFLAHDHQLTMTEVPIAILYEDAPKRNVVIHGLIVLNGILRLVGQHRPLLFLCVPGLVVFLVGLLFGLSVIEIYRASRDLATGYALITILFSVVGLLTLYTGIMLHSVRGLLLSLVRPSCDHDEGHPV